MNINNLFFELIRVAIGSQVCLSHTPSGDEWSELYAMAKKQSLVGICFAGIQKLQGKMQCPSEMLYLQWMGIAAKIQQRNEVLNRQCAELQEKLSDCGIRSAVLKGQGLARLYSEPLRVLRQSGDIDLWVDTSKEKIVELAEMMGITEKAGYLHVGARCFEHTEVELHYRPTYMRSLRHNKRLQEFCEAHKSDWTERNGMIVPSWKFDVVYQLSHIYRHLFGVGIGLRQLMDYYFLLLNTNAHELPTNFSLILSRLGLLKFAEAVMYVMREVFHMEERYMVAPVDERRGRMLLDMVMQTGNFGHQDERQREARITAVGSLKYKVKQWWQLVRLYPEETLCAPVWTLYMKLKH